MANRKTDTTKEKFLVIGIGASAGGLDAYKKFVKTIPESSGMAYILVQHLDPSHKSLLPEILSQQTRVPVYQIKDSISLMPDRIYILPSNKLVVAVDGILKLKPRTTRDKANMPVDVFFNSLATVHKEFSVGIVLSGTGKDGTIGLQKIKEYGGLTIAQEPSSAAYDGMPKSAIDSQAVNLVLPPEKIIKHLVKIARQQGQLVEENGSAQSIEKKSFAQILALLRARKLVDFTYYKQNTIKRRIERRMAIANITTIGRYLKLLKDNPAELEALFDDLLIHVTAFFRDEKPFIELKKKVFPEIIKNKSLKLPLRIWVPGCSTGEEVYSIAISLFEFLGNKFSRIKVQIFGTDLSEKAIRIARSGFYQEKQLDAFTPARLNQFFNKVDGQYHIAKFIRDICVFATHNFVKDPPFARMDLVSCRNVLIYLDSFLQKKALTTFHYSLNENGFLLLGQSEAIGNVSELFSIIDKHEKIYSKKHTKRHVDQHIAQKRQVNTRKEKDISKPENLALDFQKKADDILLRDYAPACVVINDQADIVHFRGDTSPFLALSAGKPILNVLRMARQGLAFELRSALHKVKAKGLPFGKEGIPIHLNGIEKIINIKIIPLVKTIEPYYLVLFEDAMPVGNSTLQGNGIPKGKTGNKQDNRDKRIRQLEHELAQTREDMRSIVEEQEAANEELQSANEELLSGSEELQSLNEELETTKEELQSANEEMIVVNHELTERNILISDARKYADGIIATVREPLVILNKDLVIRTASKSFYNTFHLSPQDIEGKLLYEISNREWDIPELRVMLQNIAMEKQQVPYFEVRRGFPSLGERDMLLHARLIIREADEERLILLAIDDVTEKKQFSNKLESLNAQLESKVEERTAQLTEVNNQLLQSNDYLQQFAHVASHDLKEPLRKIKTYINRIEEDAATVLSEKGKSYLSKVHGASDRMATMIEGVLKYSMLNASKNAVEHIDLNDIVKNIETDLEILIHEKKAKLTYSKFPEIEGAGILIYQLFYNLINNSLKFTDPGKNQVISITSKTIRLGDKDYAVITIKDKGIGFESRYAEKIFDTFARLNPTEKFEGTGLGLTLCRKIAERHGGTLSATGKKGHGATFTITLPFIQANNRI